MIRIYGPLEHERGDQTVVHVHGAFPYLFVALPASETDPQSFASNLQASIDQAISKSFNQTPDQAHKFVKSVEPCKGFDIYGYSVGFTCFLKISMLNPTHVLRCANLLIEGIVIPGLKLQPYEAHIPYLLAFLSDYDLYGCGWMEFDYYQQLPSSRLPSTNCKGSLELRVDVQSIANRSKISHTSRHTAIAESPAPHLTISSLSEIRAIDAERRASNDLNAWNSEGIKPQYQSLSREWDWEFKDKHQKKLNKLIEENNNSGVLSISGNNDMLDKLPTVDMLVPSKDRPSPSSVETVTSEPELHDLEVLSPPPSPIYSSPSSSPSPPSSIPLASSSVNQTTSEPGGMDDETELIPPFSLNGFQSAFQASSSFIVDQSYIEDPPDIDRSAAQASQILESQFSQPQVGSYGRCFVTDDTLQFQHDAPTSKDVRNTYGITEESFPHYSDNADVGAISFNYGGKEHRVKSLEPKDLPPFEINPDPSYPRLDSWIIYEGDIDTPSGFLRLEYSVDAPTSSEVSEWLKTNNNKSQLQQGSLQSGNTTTDKFQFPSLGSPDSRDSDMSMCALEIFATSKPGKVPNPAEDAIVAVFYRFDGLDGNFPSSGVITSSPQLIRDEPYHLIHVGNELRIIETLMDLVIERDPDILCGYEIQSSSWGYVRQRYQLLNELQKDTFYPELGRVLFREGEVPNYSDAAETVKGRHLLNLWDIMRKEVTLSKYNLEYVALNALHTRIPHYSNDTLTSWWESCNMKLMNSVRQYWESRVDLVVRLFLHFEIINRTCERSRVVGVDFMSSLTRGSQFQVESIMSKLSKRENFLLISPSRSQVSHQNALEQIPLVMEPKSAFYTDPVCVFDFRSLYPSIIIAYNLCYSTCIGRVEHFMGKNRIGIKEDHRLQRNILNEIGLDNIYVAPNGVGYVSPKIRKSLLAQMLGEILDTRFMINDSRKQMAKTLGARTDRNLNSQQLALKFIANVTYGYTSASFSGRMPCAELADSIVLAGKELLTWSMRKAESMTQWGIKPEVVYGDTDSLFVRFPGVSVQQAFSMGSELASIITSSTPDPIHLKLEKVYSPSILLTKKRYVGRAFEFPKDLTESRFDAKGIETIRRDGVPITQKIERRVLDILFDTKDLSKVKNYLQNKWRRILGGHIQPQNFCFARQVKLGAYRTDEDDDLHLPGGAVVSLRAMRTGERAAPQYRERVSFIVTLGAPGSLITERVMSPEEFMRTPNAKIDAEYYIRKVIIPPLERLFNLLGANVEDWYNKMPRVIKTVNRTRARPGVPHSTELVGPAVSDSCIVCEDERRVSESQPLCQECIERKPAAKLVLGTKLHHNEQKLAAAYLTCQLCSTVPAPPLNHPCESMECPVFFERESATQAYVESKMNYLQLT